jgi:eukaryotic-like serine/threonine-protein kinase
MSCPSEETFVFVLAGRSPPAAAAAFHEHVERCGACSALLGAMAAAATAGLRRAAAAHTPISGTERTAYPADGDAGGALEIDIRPGARIHQYELIRELGRGGMGMVWSARDLRLGRRVAIKFLLHASRGVADRFLTEARATAQCSHDNIVIIHEVEEIANTPYMVLELLDGSSLRDVIDSFGPGARLPPSRVIELVLPIARALERAHELGIVHRDLKPENVFVTNAGQVKVLDFGIAKALGTPERLSSLDLGSATLPVNLTREGSMIGTLPYMSPEQMGVGAVDHRTDLWAVGIMMFEMLVGRHPIVPFTLDALLSNAVAPAPMPTVLSLVPDVPEALSAIVETCLHKAKADRFASATDLVRKLEELAPGRAGRALAEGESPYPGLTAFQEGDADRFFGRARDVARMVARVRELPITGVIGPSGVGKSSFVRAGVGPALKASGERWDAVTMRPGRQPIAALANVIGRLTTTVTGDGRADDLLGRLQAEPGYAGTVMRQRAQQTGGHVLLFVDQFEELYTLVADAAERRAFTAALSAIADDSTAPTRVVVSMRSDFVDRISEDPHFMEELSRGLVFLSTPDRRGLREALVAPVEMVGHRFESPAMIDDMLDALGSASGALPLLQFAAAKLWDGRDRKRRLLTTATYHAIGGITGALAAHADEVLASQSTSSQKLAHQIFRRLVTPERTRAIVELTDLHQLDGDRADIVRTLDQLVAARLLVVQTRGEAGGGTVEIVHESLIDRWPTLRRWLDEDQDDAAMLAQLAAAAKQWDAKQRPHGLLWRGEAMEEARRWYAVRPRRLPDRERAFLDAAFALARRGQRLRRAALIGAFAVLAAIAGAAFVAFLRVRDAEMHAIANADRANDALARRDEEERQRVDAEQRKLDAEREKLEAEKRRLEAEADMQAARTEAQQTGESLAESREELKKQNEKLRTALDEARAARTRAEQATGLAQQKTAEAVNAQAQLRQAIAEKNARILELEAEKRKLVTRLEQ